MKTPIAEQYTSETVNPIHKPISCISFSKASQIPKGIPVMLRVN